MNGQLFANYDRISNMLGLPSCSNKHWVGIAEWLGEHVTAFAEWTCEAVRRQVVERGDRRAWVVSFDKYYQTLGHYSSATLHYYETSRIALFKHRTKRGLWHNWAGKSNGAEGDMFNEILGEVKDAEFNVTELVTDKDASTNGIYCQHFPESTVIFFSNHSAQTLHKDLQKIKQENCQVSYRNLCVILYSNITMQCQALGLPRYKRMSEALLGRCKASLDNLIASDAVQESEDPYLLFSEGALNFYQHYCLTYLHHTGDWNLNSS